MSPDVVHAAGEWIAVPTTEAAAAGKDVPTRLPDPVAVFGC